MRKVNYWTKEKCQEVALKYETKNDFRLKDNYPYVKSYKNGWLDDICSHMQPDKKKPRGYWTKEKCIECLSLNEKFRTAYAVCYRNGWLKSVYEKFKSSKKKPKGYWTIEHCQEEALKYKSRKDFRKGSSWSYLTCLKNGWIDDVCKHMKPIGNLIKRCIYVFEFSDNCAYIGLTYNYDERILKHQKDQKSSVYKHINSGNSFITKQLTDYISIEKSTKLEKFYVELYKKNKWLILNKIKTGGVGSVKEKWTYDKCKEEALKYTSRKEFHKSTAYHKARRNGWLDDVCSHMEQKVKPSGYWTKERCAEIALKYKTRKEFNKNDVNVYNTCVRNDWLDDVCSHMIYKKYKPKGYWTKENCEKEAIKYKTRKEFKTFSSSAYNCSVIYGWLDEICKHMISQNKPKNFWTKERCISEIKKYKTKNELKKNNPTVYRKSLNNKWFDEINY